MSRAHLVRAAALVVLAAALAGCSLHDERTVRLTAGSVEAPLGDGVPGLSGLAVADPGDLRGGTRTADLLVLGSRTLPPQLRARIAGVQGVDATVSVSLASVPVDGQLITVGAVDPASYRRFTPASTARSRAVWQRVAAGDLAMSRETAEQLDQPLGGDLVLGNQLGARTVRVGALGALSPHVHAVVNLRWRDQLGMLPDNAVLVSAVGDEVDRVAETLERLGGARVTVSRLAVPLSHGGQQTAFLTGGSVAQAVGSFSYRYFADGTVEPDPAWVAGHIRTEPVPLLGQVTCHRVMLPQLRGALQEVVDVGLADSVDPSDFGGCYVPRFIDRNPSRGLSLHTWGIAVDLNVAGNHRGTVGEIDRRVVAIFKKWGFAWGGDWAYTDPMHFELAALVRPRG